MPGPAEPPGGPGPALEVRYEAVGRVLLGPGAGPDPAPVLLGVHGYGQDPARFFAWLRATAPAACAVAVPVGPETFYRGAPDPGGRASAHAWIGSADRAAADARNDRYLAAVCDALGARAGGDVTRLWLAGFSQGVGVALHFALGARPRVRGLLALAGGFAAAYRARLPALAGLPLLCVSGTQDAAYPPAYVAALRADFERAGLAVTHRELEAGHDLLEAARAPAALWLAAQLPPAADPPRPGFLGPPPRAP